MKKYKPLAWVLIVLTFAGQIYGQSNLLENGSFEWNYPIHYPQEFTTLFTTSPDPWLDFNPNGDERWYTDSIWVPAHQNDPNPEFQNGYYLNGPFNSASPWEGDTIPDPMIPMQAHSGRCYVGFNARSDWVNREGIQTKIQSDWPLNSGSYSYSLAYARAYDQTATPRLAIYLAKQSSNRRRRIDKWNVANSSHVSGQWYTRSGTFELKLNRNKDMGNKWISVTGRTQVSSTPKRYVFVDDFRLYRPCDVDSACFRSTGQICPTIATQSPPASPFVIKDIGNANSMQIRIYAGNSGDIIDTTYTNRNGLPDFYMQPDLLASQLASSTYQYEITLNNKCGALEKTGSFTVLNGIYDTLAPWVDSTAFWSETPIECCLHTLTLRDMEINGDVSYVVKDTIWITDGVTAADSSHILIQAGQVVELDSVEFDGATSTVEILEAPCQGCRLAPPSPEGTAPSVEEIGKEAVISGNGPGRNALALSETGGESWKSPIEEQTDLDKEAEMPVELGLSAFPNPFDEVIALEFDLQKPEKVNLRILDAEMRLVLEVLDGQWLWSGKHSYRVELGEWATGIYFVQLESERGKDLEKVVKQ